MIFLFPTQECPLPTKSGLVLWRAVVSESIFHPNKGPSFRRAFIFNPKRADYVQ